MYISCSLKRSPGKADEYKFNFGRFFQNGVDDEDIYSLERLGWRVVRDLFDELMPLICPSQDLKFHLNIWENTHTVNCVALLQRVLLQPNFL